MILIISNNNNNERKNRRQRNHNNFDYIDTIIGCECKKYIKYTYSEAQSARDIA